MPKKIRRKKEKSYIHRKKQLDKIVKLLYNNNIQNQNIALKNISSSLSNSSLNNKNSSNLYNKINNEIPYDIIKSLIISGSFILIILCLYFIENKYHFINYFGKTLLDLLLQKFHIEMK